MEFRSDTFKGRIEEILALEQSEKLKNRIFGRLNLQVIECDEEKRLWADYYYESKEEFLNPYDGVHGGAACAMADSCMGTTICASAGELPSTTDISISYLRPMMGKGYRIHCEIKKTGKTLVACACEISDMETNALCVTVMGKFILVKKDILA